MKLRELKTSEMISVAIKLEKENFETYRYLWLLLGDFNLEVAQISQKLSKQKFLQKEKLQKEFDEHYSEGLRQISLADMKEDIEPFNTSDDYFDRFDPIHVLNLALKIERQAQCLYQDIARRSQEFKLKSMCKFFAVSESYHVKKIEDMLERYEQYEDHKQYKLHKLKIKEQAQEQLPQHKWWVKEQVKYRLPMPSIQEKQFLILNHLQRGEHCREPP